MSGMSHLGTHTGPESRDSISWNPKYNMFALAGFGHTFPVMVYVYERSEEELNDILYHTSTAAGTTVLQ
jgi:hypothetical protein